MKTVFLRALEAADKPMAVHAAIFDSQNRGTSRFDVDVARFEVIPRSPFAYWVSPRLLGLFGSVPAFQGPQRVACFGVSTKDDLRFLRLSWELRPPARDW